MIYYIISIYNKNIKQVAILIKLNFLQNFYLVLTNKHHKKFKDFKILI